MSVKAPHWPGCLPRVGGFPSRMKERKPSPHSSAWPVSTSACATHIPSHSLLPARRPPPGPPPTGQSHPILKGTQLTQKKVVKRDQSTDGRNRTQIDFNITPFVIPRKCRGLSSQRLSGGISKTSWCLQRNTLPCRHAHGLEPQG